MTTERPKEKLGITSATKYMCVRVSPFWRPYSVGGLCPVHIPYMCLTKTIELETNHPNVSRITNGPPGGPAFTVKYLCARARQAKGRLPENNTLNSRKGDSLEKVITVSMATPSSSGVVFTGVLRACRCGSRGGVCDLFILFVAFRQCRWRIM